jgi:ATP-dependent protease ClpP protease subunit
VQIHVVAEEMSQSSPYSGIKGVIMKMCRAIIVALFLYVPNALALEYYTGELSRENCVYAFTLGGKIEANDAAVFSQVLLDVDRQNRSSSCSLTRVKLNSPGGDVDEAMKIGRIIRKRELLTEVDLGDHCLSSCVLILGAGVVRSIMPESVLKPAARVGIHRPYFVSLDKGLSTTEIQNLRKQMISRMKAYADEMDLSERLIDEMMSIPPERIKILSPVELEQYRLSGVDASFDEKRTNNFAQEIGITSSELRKRSGEADKRCDGRRFGSDIKRWNQCKQAIYWNISESEIIKRERLIEDKCSGMADGSPARWECVMKILREGR